MLVILLKAVTLLGAAIAAGTAVAPTLLPTKRLTRALAATFYAALAALVLAGALEVVMNLVRLLGRAEWDLFVSYLSSTRHGHAVVARAAVAAALAAAVAVPWLRLLRWPLALALLATYSYASHAAGMGGAWPMVTDLVHYGAVAVWAGAVLVARAAPVWHAGAEALRLDTLERLSRIGLMTVLLLAFTGVISTLVHSSDPASFVTSPYALAWLVKVGIVLTTVALAAWNRFALLPAVRRDTTDLRMRRSLTAELALLLAVFVATAWLTTSALPHTAEDMSTSPIENLRRWADYLRE